MGVKGLVKCIFDRLFEVTIIVAFILFIPNLPPNTSFSVSLRLPQTKPFEGKLALNGKLDSVEIWHKGHFIGPESLADFDGELYTGLYGGDIIKLVTNHITPIVKTGKPCKASYEESICGRPLGLRFDKRGALYVADAYYGIMKVNVYTGEKQILVSPNQEIDGKKPKLFNSVAVASNGDIFWTDSSSEFVLDDSLYSYLADPSGRLVYYNAQTKTNKVLMDKLWFASGVALSDDEEFVIVAETLTSRIHRYYLKGPKNGTHDIFIDGLPGLPSNLNSDGFCGFLVPLRSSVDADHPHPAQVMLPFPLVRKVIARMVGVTHLLFKTLNRVYPCAFAEQAIHLIGNISPVAKLLPSSRATILRLSQTGEVLDSIHTLNKKIQLDISEAHIFRNTLYLGTLNEDYIARIPLSEIGWDHRSPSQMNKSRDEIKLKQATVLGR